jgi:hypothetical protein
MDPFDQAFYPTFAAGGALGAWLAWKASGRGRIGQVLVLLLAVAVVWFSLVLAVGWGYDAWQSMPDPPDEAFADGAKLTGSVLLGWLPSGFGCLLVWAIGHAVQHTRARRQSAPQP